jgi:hypothetical protein
MKKAVRQLIHLKFELTLILLEDKIYLLFGKLTDNSFAMDFQWPLSPFQAFAICLSSFDYKIGCE